MNKITQYLLYLSCLFLAGCNIVGPDFIKLDAPIGKQWLESGDSTVVSEHGDVSNWWTVFNDPILDSLIDKAYQQNLSLQIGKTSKADIEWQ